MNNPSISVVMGCYNEVAFVERAMTSILDQSYGDFEFIIVDDGSNDGTKDILQKFNDPRITLLENEQNIGLTKSLNRGILEASGKYIARMDADDISHPDRFDRQIAVLESAPGVSVVGCSYDMIDVNANFVTSVKLDDFQLDLETLLTTGAEICHGSVIMRMSTLKDLGLYDERFRYAQDYELWLRIIDEYGAGSIDVYPGNLYDRRITPTSPESYEKQRIFAKYATKIYEDPSERETYLAEMRQRIDALEDEHGGITTGDGWGIYNYRLGSMKLDDNERMAASSHLLRSIYHFPLSVRPWFLLCMVFLPRQLRQFIIDNVRLRAGRRA